MLRKNSYLADDPLEGPICNPWIEVSLAKVDIGSPMVAAPKKTLPWVKPSETEKSLEIFGFSKEGCRESV